MRSPVADSYKPLSFIRFNIIASIILFLIIWLIWGTIFSSILLLTYHSPIYGIGNVIAILEPFIDMFIFGVPTSIAILIITSIAALIYSMITNIRKKGKEPIITRKIAMLVIGITAILDIITIPGIIIYIIYLAATGQLY